MNNVLGASTAAQTSKVWQDESKSTHLKV